MLSLGDAKVRAESQLLQLDEPVVVLDDATQEFELGWVFFYQSAEFIRTGNPSSMLAGNAPVLVNRFSGEVVSTGTALPVQYYISQYCSRVRGA
jgi:hypothetical protein